MHRLDELVPFYPNKQILASSLDEEAECHFGLPNPNESNHNQCYRRNKKQTEPNRKKLFSDFYPEKT